MKVAKRGCSQASQADLSTIQLRRNGCFLLCSLSRYKSTFCLPFTHTTFTLPITNRTHSLLRSPHPHLPIGWPVEEPTCRQGLSPFCLLSSHYEQGSIVLSHCLPISISFSCFLVYIEQCSVCFSLNTRSQIKYCQTPCVKATLHDVEELGSRN